MKASAFDMEGTRVVGSDMNQGVPIISGMVKILHLQKILDLF